MARKEIFSGIDVLSGATRFFCPGLFIGEVNNSPQGYISTKVITSEERLMDAYKDIISNNLDYRLAVETEIIQKSRLSKKIENKFNKYVRRGQIDKAQSIISGYLSGRFIKESKYNIRDLQDLRISNVGILEREESKLVKGYAYPSNDCYVFNIPKHLFVIYHPTGEINVAENSFLKEAAQIEQIINGTDFVQEIFLTKGSLKKINTTKEEDKTERNTYLRTLLEDLLDELSGKRE